MTDDVNDEVGPEHSLRLIAHAFPVSRAVDIGLLLTLHKGAIAVDEWRQDLFVASSPGVKRLHVIMQSWQGEASTTAQYRTRSKHTERGELSPKREEDPETRVRLRCVRLWRWRRL